MTTPPQGQQPYGQAPYAQPYGQQPYGQNPYPQAPPAPQAPQAPYGQPQGGYAYPQPQAAYGQPQPGYPAPPQQPFTQGGAPVPPPQPAKRRSPKSVLRVIGAVLGLVFLAVAWISSMDDASSAEVGDCVKKSSSSLDDGLSVVDCGTSEAQYKVAAVHDDTSDPSVCPAPQSAYTKNVHRRRGSDTHMVLCLTSAK